MSNVQSQMKMQMHAVNATTAINATNAINAMNPRPKRMDARLSTNPHHANQSSNHFTI